jgi:hypothetical protein
MATRRAKGQNGWTLRRLSSPAATGRRGTSAEGANAMPGAFLESEALRVEAVFEAQLAEAGLRRATPPELALQVDLAPGEASVLAVRHASGALTFHRAIGRVERVGRRGRAARGAEAAVAEFRVAVRRVEGQAGRRGLVSSALKVIVLKIAKAALDRVVNVALPKLAALWEKRSWARRGLAEGWFRVTPVRGQTPSLRLAAGVPEPGARALLLIHGTFSDAGGSFGRLAGTDFFDRVRPLYGDRIYAYNHFSVSRTPDENAAQLVKALPAGEYPLDAITYSRGGLVLRSLVERRATLGPAADGFRLGHAALVACPNHGTPLATPARWDETIGWLANLIELLPENPFTTGASFVSESLVWLASHAVNDLPGLRAMDASGPFVGELQSPPGPPADAYSALVANFHPTDALWQRAVDVGVDEFFGSANDLVVPSEGGWMTDHEGVGRIPPNRIGCFGAGGNINGAGRSSVHHLNFFGRAETADFLSRACLREPQKLAAIDLDVRLPDRRFSRGTRATTAIAALAVGPANVPSPSAAPSLPARDSAGSNGSIDTFHIVVMDTADGQDEAGKPKQPDRFARVFASYGGARVVETLRLRSEKNEQPTSFGQIIKFHERIKNYTNREKGTLPNDGEMMRFGGLLFETLFQGDVRRLYDEARSRQRGRKLDLVLTSMIPWIAEKPWEFAYDTARASFLATEEIHFVRNVLTAVPAEPIVPCAGPLRILVVSAQPVGFGQLSIEQEVEVIRRGFEPLIEAGLVTIDVLPRATPAGIHGYLSTGEYGIVHFIGHGVFDEEKQEGCLVFEDARGGEFRLGQRSVREIFGQRGVNLVFLNACQTGSGSRADFNKGVAQGLVSHGMPALVANQYSVLDSSATSFAQHFYWSLAQGRTLGESAREARIAVNYSMQGELIDWAVPVFYARDANVALCPAPAKRPNTPATTVRSSHRRAALAREIRVAVWDIDNVFPALERTLDRLNRAQNTFGFELVDMSPPLDVWDLEEVPGTPYLWAERLARRLRNKPVELGVDVLACVTRHWLRDDNWLNLYGWWPEDRKNPVVVFSAAGLAELQVEGPDTDRAITNVAVTTLAGFLGGLDAHSRGPKDCPMFSNDDREMEVIVSKQEFDPTCRKRLMQKLSKAQLVALEALLNAFQQGGP